jgi:metallo-beta-lactamase class B
MENPTLIADIRSEHGEVGKHAVCLPLTPHYRLVAKTGHPASYPGIATDFEHTFATLRALPCDIFLGAHGGYFDMLAKLDRMPKEGPAVFIDAAGYQAFISDARHSFEATLAAQRNDSR